MAGSNTCVGHKRGQSSGSNKQKQTAGTADSNLIAINSSLVCFGVLQTQLGELIALEFVLHVGLYASSGIGKIQNYSVCTMHKKEIFQVGLLCTQANSM
jgi:hypothetical protein